MPDCFVIMPVTTPDQLISTYNGDPRHFQHVLEYLFEPALVSLGYSVIPPTASGADVIHAEIISRLESSELVLCDMSILNPNVFFELGIRTALDKPISLVCDSLVNGIPFDTGIVNYYTYEPALEPWSLNNQVEAIKKHISESFVRCKEHNPLWRQFSVTKKATVPVKDLSVQEQILALSERVDNIVNAQGLQQPYIWRTGISQVMIDFIETAKNIASTVGAQLHTKNITNSSVVFDLSSFVLAAGMADEIAQIGERNGISVKFISSPIKAVQAKTFPIPKIVSPTLKYTIPTVPPIAMPPAPKITASFAEIKPVTEEKNNKQKGTDDNNEVKDFNDDDNNNKKHGKKSKD